jgi:hypothetical protein
MKATKTLKCQHCGNEARRTQVFTGKTNPNQVKAWYHCDACNKDTPLVDYR